MSELTDVSLLISTDWMMRNFIADVWNAANFLQNDLVVMYVNAMPVLGMTGN